jgi:hypothetical protein
MKDLLARLALRWHVTRFLRDPNPLHCFLGQAIQLQIGRISDDQLRHYLDDYFAGLDRHALMEDIDFAAQAQRLNRPGGYKADVVSLREDRAPGRPWRRWTMWGRRFGLLRRLGIRADLLILRQGEQIPPHGHYRVVSGFYVLEGEVAVRHYDRVREESNVAQRVLVRKVLDTILGPGGYTTNSEYHHNVHWLFGRAPVSYLYRMTVTGAPTQTFGGPNRQGERVYLDPSGPADESGLIAAPYVSASAARDLRFYPAAEACPGVRSQGSGVSTEYNP